MSRTASLGSLRLGEGFPVRIMVAVNVSPESFYAGSVATRPAEISRMVRRAIEDGAEVVDVGAMSTAPYLKNEISEREEVSRVTAALRAIGEIDVPISVDTLRARVAEAALEAGATVVNDVSGLKADPRMAGVVRERGASLLAMAHSLRGSRSAPIVQVRRALEETMGLVEKEEIDEERVVLDPGIGFFREEGAGVAYSPQRLMRWYEWDLNVLADLDGLRTLGRPLCVGVSRKSFLGKVAGAEEAGGRLSASLAATAIAVMNGAAMIRTHDVRETLQAVKVAEAILRRGLPADPAS